MGGTITYSRPDGESASGYFAGSGRENAPGIVVIQEWWGVQGQIKGLCDRLAGDGYDALAPDLYGGTVVPYHDMDAAAREMNSLDFVVATDQIVRGAALHFTRTGRKAGITGFCMGGVITILAAIRVAEFSAAVCFYGIPPAEVSDLGGIPIPFQGHFANLDNWCTPAEVDRLEAALKATGGDYEIYRYDADHGFMNEERPDVHKPEEAALAWNRARDFWRRHLG